MAALTPTVTQLFSRWGCVSAAVGGLEGVFGATGGKKHQYNGYRPKSRLFHSFSLQPTEGLTAKGCNAPRSQLWYWVQQKQKQVQGKDGKDRSLGWKRFRGPMYPDSSTSISKQSWIYIPALCRALKGAVCARRWHSMVIIKTCLPFWLKQLAHTQCFH